MKHHSPGFLKIVDDAKTRVRCVSVEHALASLGANPSAVLVDVREDDEWVAGHVGGAVHLGKGIIERDIEAAYPDKSTKLYLYCGGGYRSALVADNLTKMGYTNAISVDGGFRALQAQGLEIETGRATASPLSACPSHFGTA